MLSSLLFLIWFGVFNVSCAFESVLYAGIANGMSDCTVDTIFCWSVVVCSESGPLDCIVLVGCAVVIGGVPSVDCSGVVDNAVSCTAVLPAAIWLAGVSVSWLLPCGYSMVWFWCA